MLMKMKKRLLSILLTLALVLGLMPGMSLTALAATEQSETIGTTATTVNGTHFKISASKNYAHATYGVYGLDGGITVTPKNNEYITKVVITCGYAPSYVTNDRTTVSSGTKTITDGGGTITVTDVNASTFNFYCNSGMAMFNQFVVYYLDTYEVTYKVVNGTWSDDSTDDKTDHVPSGLKPTGVPTGMKAASGYTDGAWDTNPADATITGATTFTYTFKQAATDTKAPTANALTSNGTPQPLVKPGSVEGGTMYYALGSNSTTAPADGWSTEVPIATEAGTYYVWYKVVGDANHNDVDPVCVVVTIAAASTSDYTLLASLKTSGKKALKMGWTAVPGAEGYDVFFGMCNKGDCQLLASVNGTSYKIKGLKKGFAYKAYVRAWKNEGGAKVYIGEPSPDVHAITNGKSNRYTNPKKISVKKKKLTVGVGKTKAIKAKLKKFSNSRNYLNHVSAKVRYYSSDRTVATVSANGRVTGVGPDRCTVFAVAENGLRVGVKVTVK